MLKTLRQMLRSDRLSPPSPMTGAAEPASAVGRWQLLLHAGTPKTGTTALQHAWQNHRADLLTRRILYPQVDLLPGSSPRHQWLVSLLLARHFDAFEHNVRRVRTEAERCGASRVILSTEGIFNHWFDLDEAGKARLASLREFFDVKIWIVFREPVAWAMAMYVQAAKNPPYPLAPPYATVDPPEKALKHDFFSLRLRYDAFVKDVERVFGGDAVIVTRYEDGDIVAAARRLLSLDENLLRSDERRNPTLSALGLDLLMRLNGLKLAPEPRARCVAAIVELDATLGATGGRVVPSREVRDLVLDMSRESSAYLAARFGVEWPTKSV